MKHFNIIILMLWLATTNVAAQYVVINGEEIRYSTTFSGKVFCQQDDDTTKVTPLGNATIQLFKLPEMKYRAGCVTDSLGRYSLNYWGSRSRLLLRVSYLGMEQYEKRYKLRGDRDGLKITNGQLNESNHNDSIVMKPKVLTQQEVKVIGELKKMYMSGDTLIYNTDAFKVSEDAVLMDLVKKLPGVVYDNGKLTYQGKPIEEIKLNGDKFLPTATTLKAMPVSELEKLKVYEEKTERSKLLGIDDGKRVTVMDMKTKRDMSKVTLSSVSGNITNRERRYKVEGSSSLYIQKKGMINADISTGNLGSGGESLPTHGKERSDNAFIRFRNNKGMHGTLQYSYWKNSDDMENAEERYMDGYSLYDLSSTAGDNSNNSKSGTFNMLKRISKKYSLSLHGSLSHSHGKGFSESKTASFKGAGRADIKDMTIGDFDNVDKENKVNSTEYSSTSKSDNTSLNIGTQLTRFFSGDDNAVSLNINMRYGKNDSETFNRTKTRYYQIDSTNIRNEYITSQTESKELSTSLSYTFKLANKTNADISAGWSHERQNQNHNQYDLASLQTTGNVLGTLPDNYADGRIDSLCSSSESTTNQAELSVGIRSPWENKLNYYANIRFFLERTSLANTQGTYAIDTAATFHGVSPSASLGYTTKNNRSVRLSYFGSSESPQLEWLMPMIRNEMSLLTTEGNPDLKSSYTNNIDLTYSSNVVSSSLSWRNTINEVTQKEEYDKTTGRRRTRPVNVNGSWSATAALGVDKYWGDFRMNVNGRFTHHNRVGYMTYTNGSSDDGKRTMKSDNAAGGISLSYQWTYLDLELSQDVDYQKSEYMNTAASTMEATNYKTVYKATARTKVGLELASDVTYTKGHGFMFEEANRSATIWNVSAKYSFLKKKAATVMLTFYDLLRQKNNITQSAGAFGNTSSNSRRITSYAMLSLAIKLNAFR